MSSVAGDMLATYVPFAFIAAGVLLAGYQRVVDHHDKPRGTIEIDPDIRVRVTGKIS